MKSRLNVTVLLFLCLSLPKPASAQQPVGGSPKSIQGSSSSSIDNRSMPEDHFRLAEYFRDLAAREQALAKSYDRIAKVYREKTLPPGLDPASARELKNQYKRLAETERKAAEAAATVAGYHARMAGLVERLPAEAAKQANPQDAAFRR